MYTSLSIGLAVRRGIQRAFFRIFNLSPVLRNWSLVLILLSMGDVKYPIRKTADLAQSLYLIFIHWISPHCFQDVSGKICDITTSLETKIVV